MKYLTFLSIIFLLFSCSPNPYQEICSNFVKNYCKGKEFFEDTLYFTNEFVENHKREKYQFEMPCNVFNENFNPDSKYKIVINGGFSYTRLYENDKFLDTLKSEKLKQIIFFKNDKPKNFTISLVNQNGIWKIHHFNFSISNQTLDPVEE